MFFAITFCNLINSYTKHQTDNETLLTKTKKKKLCIFVSQAITQDKQDLRNMYQCPVYKTRTRGPTYVWTFNLKSKDKPSKWTLAGVALLLQV